MGKYTDEAKVAAEVGIKAFTADTIPTISQVTTKIASIESRLDSQGFGKQYVTNVFVDIPVYPPEAESFAETGVSSVRLEGLTVPASWFPFRPILTISAMSKRTSGLEGTQTFETLKEYDGTITDADFVKLVADNGYGVEVGWGIKIFSAIPLPGDKRLKADYFWGWDLPTDVLEEYATLVVAEWVVSAKLLTGSPIGAKVTISSGLETVMGRNEAIKLKDIQMRLHKIEMRFPKKLHHVAQKTLR